MVISTSVDRSADDARLWRALAEQVKLPLVPVARMAGKADAGLLPEIQNVADNALRFIDTYLLSIELQSQPYLELEPVSVGAILQDVANQMNSIATQNSCQIVIDIAGRYEPIMTDRSALIAAYGSLVQVYIQALHEEQGTVVLGVHRDNRGKLVAGVFSGIDITSDMYRRAQMLYGRARQAVPAVDGSSGVGIFVADSILSRIASPLRVVRHGGMSGLGTSFVKSDQLSLV